MLQGALNARRFQHRHAPDDPPLARTGSIPFDGGRLEVSFFPLQVHATERGYDLIGIEDAVAEVQVLRNGHSPLRAKIADIQRVAIAAAAASLEYDDVALDDAAKMAWMTRWTNVRRLRSPCWLWLRCLLLLTPSV